MSRELRTPLNGIIEAIISVLTGEHEASLRAGSKDSAARRRWTKARAFLRTLQNILDLWKIKQGELPVEIQDVNFRELDRRSDLQRPGRTWREAEPAHRADAYRGAASRAMRTDLAKLSQILFLLLDNAVEVHRRRQRSTSTRGLDEGADLVCEIQDTGIGICPDDREFVFDEFYQVDDSVTSRYRGAGLGLTLVRDLVALLDGELELESEVGVGTRVRVRVPVERTPVGS